MRALEKRIEALEKQTPCDSDEVLFVNLVPMGEPDCEVRRYRGGGQVFDRFAGETVEAFQERVQASAPKPDGRNMVVYLSEPVDLKS